MHFLGRKINFSSLKFFFLNIERLTFMKVWKHFIKDKNLCLKKSRTLGAWNRHFSSKGGREGLHAVTYSYAFLGICEAIFGGRYLIFCVEPHIIIYFKDIKSFFNLNNLEPAPGRPSSLFLVHLHPILELDVLEQAPGCQNKKKIIPVKYILIWGSTQKNRSLPLKMASQIPKNA